MPNKNRRTRKQAKAQRSQRGGLKYKYTHNASRRDWVDTLYPFGPQILSIIGAIPWNSWFYAGKSKVALGPKSNTRIIETDVNVHLSSPPFHMFGGCVTEIYARNYNSSDFPKLSDYADPTSDIDVRISPFVVNTDDTTLTGRQVYDAPHTRHFIDWLLNQLRLGLAPVADAMRKKPFRKMARDENAETSRSTHSEYLGNILLSETPNNREGYTKIQVGVGIIGGSASHFLEFVINHNKHLPINQMFPHNFANFNNVYTLNFVAHLYEQLNALADRHRQPHVPRNKVYNHYGRVYYTLKLLAHLVETQQIAPISHVILGDIDAALHSDLFSEQPSPCPNGCDVNGMRQLIDIISGLGQDEYLYGDLPNNDF